MTLILASQSASRRAMLDAAGVTYEAMPAYLDERALEARSPTAHREAETAKAHRG